MVAKAARKPLAIVVPPNAQSLDVSGPLDAFLEANRQSSGGAFYEVRLIAAGARRTVKAGGMSLVADSSIFDDVRSIDTLLVAGTPDYALAHTSTDDLQWLDAATLDKAVEMKVNFCGFSAVPVEDRSQHQGRSVDLSTTRSNAFFASHWQKASAAFVILWPYCEVVAPVFRLTGQSKT
jgi:hypothetical protein